MTECFRIDSGVRQGYIMSSQLFNVHMDAVKEVKMEMEIERGRGRVELSQRKT